jgi:hypothetical protein
MFRIEFFVDDKKLPAALHALMGVSHGAPTVTPVANAIKTKNGLAAASNGSGLDRFIAALGKHKGEKINAARAREIMREAGCNPESISYYLKGAREAGALRKAGTGSGTTYAIVK